MNKLILVCVLIAGCGGSTTSGSPDANLLAQAYCSDNPCVDYDKFYRMPSGTYQRAVTVEKQCHLETVGECPREEERICVEVMRGALKDYPRLIEDTRESWDQHWQSKPCGG